VPPRELLGIHAMAALDLAILIGAPRLDVPMADALAFDGEHEGERELGTIVGLQLPDGKREGRHDLTQEVEAGEGVLAPIETQHAEPSAVIARGVLKGFGVSDLDDLDIHLDRFPGRGLLEELELALAEPRGMRPTNQVAPPLSVGFTGQVLTLAA